MCEQTGKEIDWEKCPPEIEDFPSIVHIAMEIYNSLGDKVFPDVGFTGKDFTNLLLMYELHCIEDILDKDYIMELLLLLDTQLIKQSQEQIKAQYDKIKKK